MAAYLNNTEVCEKTSVIILNIIKIALPAVGEMILYMLIWIVDTMMVGKYGGEFALSATGVASEVFYTVTNLFVGMGIGIAMTSIISRALGAKNLEHAKKSADMGMLLIFLISILMNFIFTIFSKELMILMKVNGSTLLMATKYFRICSYMVSFTLLRNGLSSIFIGCQDTKTPLYTAAIINFINIALDYVLIFGKFGFPELGVEGAAWATVIANFFGFIYICTRLKKLPFKIGINKSSLNEYSEILKLAIPSSFQEGAFSVSRLLGIAMIMALGNQAFAANQITVAIESISFMPGYGIAVACSTLVGYSIGEKNMKKVQEYFKYSTLMGIIIMGIAATFFYTIPEFFVSLFLSNNSKETSLFAISCLKIAAFTQIPSAICMILEGGMKGAGNTKKPFYIVLFCNWAIRLPLMWYFIYLKNSPIIYAWRIIAFQWMIESIIIIYVVYNTYFKNIKNIIKKQY